jgi:hypothetical protein
VVVVTPEGPTGDPLHADVLRTAITSPTEVECVRHDAATDAAKRPTAHTYFVLTHVSFDFRRLLVRFAEGLCCDCSAGRLMPAR